MKKSDLPELQEFFLELREVYVATTTTCGIVNLGCQ